MQMSSSLHVMGAHQIPLPICHETEKKVTLTRAMELQKDVCCVDIVPGGDEEAADHGARGAHVCTVHPSYELHQLSCLLPCDHVVLLDPAYRHKQCIYVSK